MEVLIKGFELLEADGGGVSDNHLAYVEREEDAKEWVSLSKGWRRYRPYEKTIIVHHSLDSLYATQRELAKQRALAKLTKEEREVLGF